MPVSDAHGIVFVHVPKTAGTSVLVALGLQPGRGEEWDATALTGWDPWHVHASHYTLHEILEARPDAAGYERIACVRNPFTRVVSWWAYVMHVHQQPQTRESFARHVMRLPRVSGGQYLQTQWDAVRLRHRVGVQALGRFEALGEWWDAVRSRHAALPPLGLENRIAHPPASQLYDDKTARHVRHAYAADFDAFGYGEEVPP